MPNSPAADIVEYLLALSPKIVSKDMKGTLPLVSVGIEPEVQNRAILTIYDTGGPPANPAYQRDYPRIQVRTKSKAPFDYPSAYNLQQQIKDILLGIERFEINGTLYVGIWQQTDIATLTSDYNNRPVLVSNYRMVREYETSNRLPIE